MINYSPFIVFDFETTGKDPKVDLPVEIGAKAYHSRSLEPLPNAEFSMLCNPPEDVKIHPEALEISKIKLEDVRKAPSLETVWKEFVNWVGRFNSKKDKWTAPIACGHNIDGYDIPIANHCNKLFGPKKEDTVLFSNFRSIDLLDLLFPWFENNNELENYKLGTVTKYFGLEHSNSHRALNDVQVTGQIIMRILKLHRNLSPKVKFKDAFAQKN